MSYQVRPIDGQKSQTPAAPCDACGLITAGPHIQGDVTGNI